jgi:hypothetical protein
MRQKFLPLLREDVVILAFHLGMTTSPRSKKKGRHRGLPLHLIIFLDEKIRSKNYFVLFALLMERIKIDLIIISDFSELHKCDRYKKLAGETRGCLSKWAGTGACPYV